MGRPRKDSYFSDEELTWFKLSNYDGLAEASFEKWAQVIFDRSNLKLLLENSDNVPLVQEQFKKLQKDPLHSLGFSLDVPKRHAVDTDSVKLMTIDMVHALSTQLADHQLGNASGTCAADEQLKRMNNAAIPFAHLSVDLRATDTQLHDDFKSLVREWRRQAYSRPTQGNYRNKVMSWHRRRIIPYFDLYFCARLYDRTISRSTYAKLLGLAISTVNAKEKLDELSSGITEIVSLDTFHILRMQREDTTPPSQ